MDYEKAYKEAFKRAERRFDPNPADGYAGYANGIIEDIFPQFIKREDERTRKEILDFIKHFWADHKESIPRISSWLAWLEKQKERKPILEVFGFKVGDAVRFKDGDGRKHIIKSFEEVEGLHGPNFYHVEFEDNSARSGIYTDEEYPNGYYTQMEKIEEEQKPAEWGEEDNNILEQIIMDYENEVRKLSSSTIDEQVKSIYKKRINWLKHLPERFNLQPKKEWSKEDEKIINTIVSALGQYIDYKSASGTSSGYATPRYGKEIDWLKSLKPQPKQEWNKEDEKMLSRCIKSIESSKQFADSSVYEKDKEINWLKDIPERLDLQPKQEWSEEDEEKMKAICTYLRDYSRLAKLDDKLRFNEYCDFLESLRPSWKPSEEQMDAFKGYIEDFQARAEAAVGGWNNFDVMIRLYEQLKKLM